MSHSKIQLNYNSEPLNAYIEHLNALKRSPATIATRRQCLTRFLNAHPDARLQDITTEHIGRYRKSMADANLTQGTINTNLTCIKAFFQFLTDRGLIFDNPMADTRIASVKSVPHVLSETEVMDLLNTPDTKTPRGIRDRAILEVLYSTAIRRDELLKLKITDIDFNQRTVLVFGKGSKERLLPIGPHACEWTQRYLNKVRPKHLKDDTESALWLTRFGLPMKGTALTRIFKSYKTVSAHTLRRSCATHMLAHGAHPLAICELLGHATVETVTHYLKVDIEDIKKTHKATKPGK